MNHTFFRFKINIGKLIRATFLLAVISLFLWMFIRIFIADYFSVNTHSMYPTIKPGSTIVVNKLIFGGRIYTKFDFESEELNSFRVKGLRKIRVNDIVVFNYPFDDKYTRIRFKINYVYVKRIAGVPGDTISIRSGFYKNNNYQGVIGFLDNQSRLFDVYSDSLLPRKSNRIFSYYKNSYGWSELNFGPLYVPRKGDSIKLDQSNYSLYKLIIEHETGKIFSEDTEYLYLGGNRISEYIFKGNYYFVAGDNVSNSIDSRQFGFVPEAYIIGVVKWILPHNR